MFTLPITDRMFTPIALQTFVEALANGTSAKELQQHWDITGMTWTQLDFTPGIDKDNSPLKAGTRGRFIDADKIRFVDGLPETIYGWERASTSTLLGLCRGAITYADNACNPFAAFGTHLRLYAMDVDGNFTDITPVVSRSPAGGVSISFTTVSGSPSVTAFWNAHGLDADQKFRLENATVATIGGVAINGTYTVANVVSANRLIFIAAHAANAGVGQQRAAFRAGNAGAFGNKRTGVAEANFADAATRGRGSMAAGLRSQAFNTAAGFGMQDANRFLQADSTNAANVLATNQFNAGLEQQARLENARRLDERQRFDVQQADVGDQFRTQAKLNSLAANKDLSALAEHGLSRAIAVNEAGVGNANAVIGAGQTGFNQGLGYLNLGTNLFGSDETGSGSRTETYSRTGTEKRPGNLLSSAGSFLTGAGRLW